MKEIIVITESEKEQLQGLEQVNKRVHNHTHFALDKLNTIKNMLEFGEYKPEEILAIVKEASKDMKIARSYSGQILNFMKEAGHRFDRITQR